MKKKVLMISISLVLGLLCAMETSAVQQMNVSQLIGGGCDCSGNTQSNDCPSPCSTEWHAAMGSGSGIVDAVTFCHTDTGCSEDTKVESTNCSAS